MFQYSIGTLIRGFDFSGKAVVGYIVSFYAPGNYYVLDNGSACKAGTAHATRRIN